MVRGTSIRTRNARLAAIHSLFTYAALRHPEHAAVIQRVLAIPTARIQRNLVSWLEQDEADALLAACNQGTRTGRRDHALFSLAIQTGLHCSRPWWQSWVFGSRNATPPQTLHYSRP